MLDSRDPAWIFDIDGTLAHNRSGRNIVDYTRVSEDEPDEAVFRICQALVDKGDTALFVTGREDTEQCRRDTEQFLYLNLDVFALDLSPYLYMRPATEKDRFRKGAELKLEIYRTQIEPKYRVFGVFEDLPTVVHMWREEAGLSVFQCASVPELTPEEAAKRGR
jgi:hypothetical protein